MKGVILDGELFVIIEGVVFCFFLIDDVFSIEDKCLFVFFVVMGLIL